MHIKNIFLWTTGVFFAHQSFSQQTIPISYADISSRFEKNNIELAIAAQNIAGAKADYQQSSALFLPNLQVSHTGIATTNPLMAFGSKLNQAIIAQSDFNPTLLNNPEVTRNYATMIEVQQPIVNMDGYYGRLAARNKKEAYELQYARTREYLNWLLHKSYMQLQLAYKAVAVLEKADSTGKANLRLVENYYKQGLVQKTDLLRVQVHMNEIVNQLAHANTNLKNASDYLAYLLNEDTHGNIYKPTEALDNSITQKTIAKEIPESRKDLLAYNKSTEAYKMMVQSGKMSLLPRLNAFGNYQLYDKEFLGMKANGYLVGAQLSWNVFDGNKSFGKINKAKADFEKASLESEQYRKQSNLELNSTLRQLQDAANKETLTQKDFEQASEAYRILQNRFTQGLEKTTELLQSETMMLQKELEHAQAVFEYNSAQNYLQFLTQ